MMKGRLGEEDKRDVGTGEENMAFLSFFLFNFLEIEGISYKKEILLHSWEYVFSNSDILPL